MRRALVIIWSLFILLPLAWGQDYYKVRKHSRISTGRNEAAAIPFEDGVVYITESNSVGLSSPTDAEGRKLYSIYYWNKSGKIEQFRPELVSQDHEGPVSFSGDLRTMVFAQRRPVAGQKIAPLRLFFAERNENGEWVNEREFEFNDPVAWLFSPSLSYDGRTLFFSANYEDGLGGFDIYRSRLRGGAWTKPENLGPRVNSEGNEIYPFIHPMGRLYFSTDGRSNRGDFDLYETAEVNGEWYEAIKLETPMNSLSDDYHVWFSEDFKKGWLTSNRRSRSKEIFELSTEIPALENARPIQKTYYKFRLQDKKNLETADTSLFRYSWLINDTLEIPGHRPIYEFPDTGTYVCELRVFDINLDTFRISETIKTLRIALHEQAVITAPDTVSVGTPVSFDASKTYLPGFNAFRYIWEFGDGSYGEGMEVTHTYLYPGTYRVKLGVEERPRNRRDEPAIRTNYKNVTVVDSDQ
jgi:hypothetical protein